MYGLNLIWSSAKRVISKFPVMIIHFFVCYGLLVFLFLMSMPVLSAINGGIHHNERVGKVTPNRLLNQIRNGEKLTLSNIALGVDAVPLSLELDRFEVFAANALIHLQDGKTTRRLVPPNGAYYHGQIKGLEDSLAVLTVDPSGKTGGVVQYGDRMWILDHRNQGRAKPIELLSREVKQDAQTSAVQPFICGIDKLQNDTTMSPQAPAPSNVLETSLIENLPAGQYYRAKVAVETDGEFYNKFGNTTNASNYIANLFAYSTTIYEREAQTKLVLGDIYLWADANQDPWSFEDTQTGLSAFANYWQSNRTSTDRATAHFLSGKNLGGGIAWVSGLCDKDYGYGLSANIIGSFSISNPEPVWDIIVVTHEIGHNFSSLHTHNYQGIGGDSNPVDACGSSNTLPGLNSLLGGSPGAGNGTIMSYCHLLSGGYKNISLTFGKSHPYGIKAYRVNDKMSTYVAQVASNYPNCLPLVSNGYSVTVIKAGNGTGSIISSPDGINCGTTCTAIFSKGVVVNLNATPNIGSTFTGWSGTSCAGAGVCSLSMDASKSVTANFVLKTQTLTIHRTGTGNVTSSPIGVNCGNTCVYGFNDGTFVSLTASPAPGYYFGGWSGDCIGSETCTLTMDAAKKVTANFIAIPPGNVVLSVTKTGLGSITSLPVGINCSGTCNASFSIGSSVTLTAAPVTGYYFAGWSGACSGSGTCTLTLSSNQTANASFLQIPAGSQMLTVTVVGMGSIASIPVGLNCSSTCSYPFEYGTSVSLIATASGGQTFTGWTGACSGVVSCFVQMSSPQVANATFKNSFVLIMPAINALLMDY